MFFKKKGKEGEPSVDKKIARARLVKKFQLIGMYVVGILGGSAWTYTVIEGRDILVELNAPKTIVIAQEAVIKTAEAAETVVEEKPWQVGEFTAYTASMDETDANPLVMASGKMVYVGAAACPRSIPFGTKIEVKDLGIFTCEDRMNARYGDGHFDLFKVTKDEARSFGRKALEWREA